MLNECGQVERVMASRVFGFGAGCPQTRRRTREVRWVDSNRLCLMLRAVPDCGNIMSCCCRVLEAEIDVR